jgi:uncharacterized protein (DUF1684 family)
MRARRHLLWNLCLVAGLAATLATANDLDTATWRRDLLAWRTQHAADLQKPDGWLSLTGLEWLTEGDNSVGSAADNKIHLPASGPAYTAVLRLVGGAVTLKPPNNPLSGLFPSGLLVDGQPAQTQVLRVDPDKDKDNTRLTIGTLNFYVIRRATRFGLRIKDSRSPALLGFHPLKWYPPDPSYRVVARWVPYSPSKILQIATLLGTVYNAKVPGAAEFSLRGTQYRLEPLLEDPAEPKLFFVLRDTTSKLNTYPACRFLYTGFPDHGIDKPGELVLDFNHLENPPCAYTSYTTCPLPPAQNRLPIALPVGEQRYHD